MRSVFVLVALVLALFHLHVHASGMPVGNLPGWKQIFSDDFNTPAPLGSFLNVYATQWDAYPEPYNDTSKHGMYSPQKTLSVANGLLNIHMHTEGGIPRVAAPTPRISGPGTSPWTGVIYGRFSARMRADPVHGYKTAWLLWPDSERWPDDGEIDFRKETSTARSAQTHIMPSQQASIPIKTPFRPKRSTKTGTK